MLILNAIKLHPLVFIILCSISAIVILALFIFMKKEHQEDYREIEALVNQNNPADLDNINEEKQDQEVFKNQTDLENLLIKMQEDLEARPEDVITNFENVQEEQSIISYQELVQTLKKEKPLLEPIEKPIKVEEKSTTTEPIKTEIKTELGEITKVEIPEIKEEPKFKVADFISPIYGLQKSSTNYPMIPEFKRRSRLDELLHQEESNHKTMIEENLDLEPLRREIERNDEFLQALKEFRKNL